MPFVGLIEWTQGTMY